ncbi:MAG TPA: methylmalonyl-CoA mutase family protein, partial [Terriglobales bacterium]
LITDVFEYCAEHMPEWNTISISGYHIREAGCTAAQEIAFTLGNGSAYVQAALDRGLEVDRFAPRLSFFFNAHNNLLEEVAKFRAARRMWARRMREKFHARDPRSWMLRFHTQTAGSTLTAQQPLVNVPRTAYQALAGVLGGTQSLHTNAYDEALGLPTEAAARLALRTQQVLAYETGVTNVVDPLAGSYYVESLTNDLESAAEAYLEKIESWGGPLEGMLQAIETGYVQREIQNAAYEFQKALEKDEAVVVGVNRFQQAEDVPTPVLRIAAEVESRQVARLAALRKRRDQGKWQASLDRLAAAAKDATNVMPALIEAVESYATVGEISDLLRRQFGEYREAVVM